MTTRMPALYLATARRRSPTTRSGRGSSPPGRPAAAARRRSWWSPRTGRTRRWRSAPRRTVPLVYDFWGFPERYYRGDVPRARARPRSPRGVRKLLRGPASPVQDVPDRGLDHGAYVPLVEMYPDADVPVLQVSMPTLDPVRADGDRPPARPAARRGRADRRQRLLHPQPARRCGMPGRRPPALVGRSSTTGAGRRWTAAGRRRAAGLRAHRAPAGRLAHPRTEHFAPLFVTLGAAESELGSQRSVIDGFWMGLAKRSVQFG